MEDDSNKSDKSDKSDKPVTIFIVTSREDMDEDWFPSFDDMEQARSESSSNPPLPPTPIIKSKKIAISKKFKINRGNSINNLGDLIGAFEHPKADKNQKELVENMKELNNMIGMENLKNQIVDQILFFVQDLQEPGMFLHTVLTGSPGSGKTTIINILAKIYNKMGILDSSKVGSSN